MPSRALESATADLFATASCPASAEAEPASPAPPSVPGLVPDALPSARRARAQPLWYAVVFPQLAALGGAALLERLCLHALKFTPRVSIEIPNALLLEIRGSVKLFGSLATLHAGIDAAWRHLELEVSSATAPSTLGALWLARAGRRELIEDPSLLAGRLAGLPIGCTAWDGERLRALRALGVSRVGELLRLPRAGMARRFGAAAVLELDIALTRQAAPRRSFVPRERFRERFDFGMEVETVAYLQKALEPLIGRCARFLRERQAGVQTLELRLAHRNHALTRVRVGLASTTSEQHRLTCVLSQKLSQLELAAPATGMELVSGRLLPLSAVSLDVFARQGGAGGGNDTAPQLVERLRARLGDGAVYGVRSVAEHRPEAAWQRVQELRLNAVPCRQRHEIPAERPRPVWLLDVPEQLLEEPQIVEEGPERIESGWWDGKGIARDYYIVRRTGGARLWVFQERRSRRWYVHGVFA
jgi:protein ImuB